MKNYLIIGASSVIGKKLADMLAESLLNSEAKREANAQRHPLKRVGNVNDIAEMAGFLISDKSGWITGQVFHADGGISTLKI